jgi:hypothetical protein
MLEKEEIIINQIIVALVIWFIWSLASGVDQYNARFNVGTLYCAWVVTAIVACFKKF